MRQSIAVWFQRWDTWREYICVNDLHKLIIWINLLKLTIQIRFGKIINLSKWAIPAIPVKNSFWEKWWLFHFSTNGSRKMCILHKTISLNFTALCFALRTCLKSCLERIWWEKFGRILLEISWTIFAKRCYRVDVRRVKNICGKSRLQNLFFRTS